MWGPTRIRGQDQELYFLLVVDDYMHYTTVFPLRGKADVLGVFIPWIAAIRCQLRARFHEDLQVLRLHSDRGGEFSSRLLEDFCRSEGIAQSFTLPASPQQNGIAERRIGLIMEVARTSMIHVAAPIFCGRLRYDTPRISQPLAPCLSARDLAYTALNGGGWRCIDISGPPPVDPLPPQGPTPSGVSQVDPPPLVEPLEVSSDTTSPAEGDDPVVDDTAATRRSPRLETPPGFPPRPSSPPSRLVTVDSGATGGGDTVGVDSGGAGLGVADSRGAESGGAGSGGAGSGGAASPSGGGVVGAPTGGLGLGGAGVGGAASAGGTGAAGAGGTEAARAGGTGVAGARGTGATGAGRAGARGSRGAEAAGAGGPGAAGARGAGATGAAGAGGVGAGGAGGTGAAGAGGAGDGGAGATGGAALCQVLSLPSSTRLIPPLLCPPPDQSHPQLLPGSSLPAPSPYPAQTGSLPRPASPVHIVSRARHPRPPLVLGTHIMALRPSSVPQCVALPSPPASSLPNISDPESDLTRAASPIVTPLLVTLVTDPSFQSTAASSLVTELSESDCPPFVGGELTLEDRHCELECLAAVLPRLPSMLLCPEGDLDALNIPTSRTQAEAITGTYVNEVPLPKANIVDGMWIFIVKRPPGSPPPFKAHYVARGFSQRQGVVPTLRRWPLSRQSCRRDTPALTWVLQRFDFEFSLPQSTPLPTGHSLSAPPSDEFAEPNGQYPKLVGCLMHLMTTSGMGLVLGGRGSVVLTGHSDASWADDQGNQRSSQGYSFSLGSGPISWRSTHSSSVLGSSCEAEIYAGAMAAQELRWLTYLLIELGERPRSPPVLYIDNKAMIAL
ncbi:unnamed protein product [Closterium sp. NIES-53]